MNHPQGTEMERAEKGGRLNRRRKGGLAGEEARKKKS